MLNVKKIKLAALCAGVALGLLLTPRAAKAALPDAQILAFNYGGSGCPGGSARGVYDNVNHLLTVDFDSFAATMPAGLSKACNLSFIIKVPSGFQVSVNRMEYLGYADLFPNVTGDLFGWYKYDTNTFIPFHHHFNSNTHGVYDVVDNVIGGSVCKDQVTFTTNIRADSHGTPATHDISELVVDTIQFNSHLIFYIPVAPCP